MSLVKITLDLIKNTEANFVINLGKKAQVPTISFSATSPSLTSLRTQVKALSAIVKAFGWKQVVPIYIDNEYGEDVDAHLMTMQTRVFIVHMTMNLSSRLFTKAREVGMMREGYVWIVTKPSVLDSMQGVLGVKTYIPKTKELKNFAIRWKRTFQQENPNITNFDLNVFGLWAYDATSALAIVVEKLVGYANLGSEQPNASSNLIDLETIRVSKNGPKLREVLLGVRFKGLSGEFNFLNGQIKSSTFQITNVIDDIGRVVAFWTPENGLRRELMNTVNKNVYSTSKNNLRLITWPGDVEIVPKGWEIPTNGKKLRIGVPVKGGFAEFVQVPHHGTNTTQFIPFAKPDGESAGTYNDLVYQNFDAVVGDTTIIENRSKYVDFTLPYTESGVSMVVPLRDRKKNAWVFLKPLSLDLWITTACFFVFIGFVVWVLEHQVNENFRGLPSPQVGTSLWYAFSTIVLHNIVISNCARFVVIIWVFVVLILIQCYTASLTSLLIVQQLQPTITDLKQLIKNGEKVGYQKDYFDFQLKQYNSTDECHELLSKGSANGGIAAAFDEVPYMKLFLGKYCSKYTMVSSVYKTDGFGFVFPMGSPLVADISRQILNVTEGEKMKEIESAWFRENTTCLDPNTPPSSPSLDVASFWGLFLIARVASLLALIFSISMFLYKEKQHIFMPSNPNQADSIWRRILHMFRRFDKKDLNSHTFRKKTMSFRDIESSTHGIHANDVSTRIKCLPIPPIPSELIKYQNHDQGLGTSEIEHENT
ncbi:hypothetical protein I3843_15G059900 [Carya illinoinensis]|nr:hypothetical protein I3843_15G059900 [Carya illinoinensis]